MRTKQSLSKTLSIKVRSCQRLKKEHSYYKDEVEQNERKLEEMKQNSKFDKVRF